MAKSSYADLECPHCHRRGSAVKSSRGAKDYIRRRRKCFHCGKRFTTRELPEEQAMVRQEVIRRIRLLESVIKQLRDDLEVASPSTLKEKHALYVASHA